MKAWVWSSVAIGAVCGLVACGGNGGGGGGGGVGGGSTSASTGTKPGSTSTSTSASTGASVASSSSSSGGNMCDAIGVCDDANPDMDPTNDCFSCAQVGPCAAEVEQCFMNNPECVALNDCAGACPPMDQACIQG